MKLMGINFIGWFFTIVVSIILIVLAQVVWNQCSLLLTGARAQGVVVRVLKSGGTYNTVVEFNTAKGEKITYQSGNNNALPTAKVGQIVKMIYKESNPQYAQIQLWGEGKLLVILAIFWFLFVFSYIWLGLIKVSGDETMGDPFHLLPKCTWLFPFVTIRIAAYAFLSFGLFGFGATGYVFAVKAQELRTSGIKVTGVVTGFDSNSASTNGRSTSSFDFAIIRYDCDTSGGWATVKKSILQPISNIKIGDTREVIYLPDEPTDGVENTWMGLWFPTLFFSATVILFITLMVMLHNRPTLWPSSTEKELINLHDSWKKEVQQE